MTTAADGEGYLPADRPAELEAAIILAAHPNWSYRDLAETPESVLLLMDAVVAARKRHRARENRDG